MRTAQVRTAEAEGGGNPSAHPWQVVADHQPQPLRISRGRTLLPGSIRRRHATSKVPGRQHQSRHHPDRNTFHRRRTRVRRIGHEPILRSTPPLWTTPSSSPTGDYVPYSTIRRLRHTDPVSPKSVLLVDDHPLIVQALVNFFATVEEFDVVGTATDGAEAVTTCLQLRPDLVLMDLQMPRMNGVEATRRIVEECPHARVVILTTFASLDFVLPALRAGASGFLLKDTEPDRILTALNAVLTGEENMPISPQVARLLADEALGENRNRKHPARAGTAHIRLTTREKELLTLLAHGMNNREISTAMEVSEGSVKAYLGRICEKLHVRDRLQVLIRAYELGLVDPQLITATDPHSR